MVFFITFVISRLLDFSFGFWDGFCCCGGVEVFLFVFIFVFQEVKQGNA